MAERRRLHKSEQNQSRNTLLLFFALHPHNVLHEENRKKKKKKKGFLGHIHECRFARLCQNSYCFKIVSKMIQPIKKRVEKKPLSCLWHIINPCYSQLGEELSKTKTLQGATDSQLPQMLCGGKTIQQSRDLKTTIPEIIISFWN